MALVLHTKDQKGLKIESLFEHLNKANEKIFDYLDKNGKEVA